MQKNDGCSPSCKVETNFECEADPTPSSFGSVCFYTGNITTTVKYIEKVDNKNKIKIVADIGPADLNIWNGADLSDLFTLTGPSGIKSYKITMNEQGQLEIEVEYDDDIQGEQINLTVSPDPAKYPNLARAQLSTSRFAAEPTDNESAYYYDESVYQIANIIRLLCMAAAGLAWLFFLIGMISGKMIGVEMMAVLQASFVSLVSLQELNPCFKALSSLQLVNGYNSVSAQDIMEDSLVPDQPRGIFLYARFLENYNITSVLIFIPLLVGLVVMILSKTALKSKAETLEKVWKRAVGEYAFTGVLFSGYIVFTSFTLELKYGVNNKIGLWGLGSIVLSLLFVGLFIFYLVFYLLKPEFFGEYTNSFKTDCFSSKFYVIPMLERAIVGCTLVLLLSIPFEAAAAIVVFLVMGIVVLVRSPYSQKYNNRRVILNMVICLCVESIYIWYRTASVKAKHSSSIAFYLPVLVVVLLILCVIYNSAAIVYQIYRNLQ